MTSKRTLIMHQVNFLSHQNFFYKYIGIFREAYLLNLALVNDHKKIWRLFKCIRKIQTKQRMFKNMSKNIHFGNQVADMIAVHGKHVIRFALHREGMHKPFPSIGFWFQFVFSQVLKCFVYKRKCEVCNRGNIVFCLFNY